MIWKYTISSLLALVFRDHDPEGDRLGSEQNASEPASKKLEENYAKNIIGRDGNFRPFYYAPLPLAPLAPVFRQVCGR